MVEERFNLEEVIGRWRTLIDDLVSLRVLP